MTLQIYQILLRIGYLQIQIQLWEGTNYQLVIISSVTANILILGALFLLGIFTFIINLKIQINHVLKRYNQPPTRNLVRQHFFFILVTI